LNRNREISVVAVLLAALIAVVFFTLPSVGAKDSLSYQAVLDSLQVRFQKIRDYRVDVHIAVDMEGIRVPPMQATVYFKQPDHLRIISDRFAMLPKHAVLFSPGQIRRLIEKGQVLEQAKEPDGLFRVRVRLPEERSAPGGILTLWFEPGTWVLKKLEIETERYGRIVVENRYGRVAGNFYLPKRSRVTVNLTPLALSNRQAPSSRGLRRDFLSRISGKGTVYITYLNYRINQGVPDSIFERKP